MLSANYNSKPNIKTIHTHDKSSYLSKCEQSYICTEVVTHCLSATTRVRLTLCDTATDQ